MNCHHFITSRAYSDCSRTYVWCSTENTVSLFPLSKTYKSISVALINKLASPDNIYRQIEDCRGRGSIMSRHDPTFVKLN